MALACHARITRVRVPLESLTEFFSETVFFQKNFSALVVIKKYLAMVNGSNSTSNYTIEASRGESVPIRCSAEKILTKL